MLLFRGQNSPQLPADETVRNIRLWVWQIDEGIKQSVKPRMSRGEIVNIAERVTRTQLRQICQGYDLQFFSGPTDSAFVAKQTL